MPWIGDHERIINETKDHIYYLTVPGFSKYELSNHGTLRRVSDKMLISKVWTAGNRCRVTLTSDEGERKTLYFDRVVAKTFFDIEDDEDYELTFYDGNRANFSYYNLILQRRWKKQNKIEVLETGRVYRSVEDCARAIGGTRQGIYAYLEGRRDSYKGYHFRRV